MEFVYPDIVVEGELLVRGGSLDVGDGDVLLLGGKNGSGKTLLTHLLFEECTARGVSAVYVEQSSECLLPERPVLENIALSNDPKAIARARKLLEAHKLQYLIRDRAGDLSGGEKRLVCILRGVFHVQEAGVLFLDEPTNDLSPSMVKRVCEMLEELRCRVTVVVVTHDKRLLRVADEMAVIEDGVCGMAVLPVHECSPATGHGARPQVEPRVKTDGNRQPGADTAAYYSWTARHAVFIRVFSALFVFVVVLSLVTCFQTPVVPFDSLAGGQVDVFVSNSQLAEELIPRGEGADSVDGDERDASKRDLSSIGAVPLAALPALDDSVSFFDRMAEYDDALRDSSALPVSYGLDGAEKAMRAAGGAVRELSFRNLEDLLDYSVTDYCREPYGPSSLSDVAGVPDNVYQPAKRSAQNEAGRNAPCVYVSVSPDDELPALRLYENGAFDSLSGGNYYVRSKETIELVNAEKQYHSVAKALRLSLVAGILLLALDALVLNAFLRRNRNRVLVFKDVGISRAMMQVILLDFLGGKAWWLGCCVVGAAAAVVVQLLVAGAATPSLLYLPLLVVPLFCLLDWVLHRLGVTAFLKRVFRWDYRPER